MGKGLTWEVIGQVSRVVPLENYNEYEKCQLFITPADRNSVIQLDCFGDIATKVKTMIRTFDIVKCEFDIRCNPSKDGTRFFTAINLRSIDVLDRAEHNNQASDKTNAQPVKNNDAVKESDFDFSDPVENKQIPL